MAEIKEANEAPVKDNESKQKTIKLIIKRQDNSDSKPYEEEFEIPYRENLNVIALVLFFHLYYLLDYV